jgi:outer membrane receptor protein involved in Fe transport
MAAFAAAAPSLAQEAPSPSPEVSQAAEGGLDEIIVTARKRAESVQDVPVAITAFSEVQIQQKALTNVETVAAAVPSFVVGRGNVGSGAQLSIRGISSSSSSVGIEQSVAVIMDGAYYGSGRVINEGLFDLGRLEILKGPQALFYGKNATAGVVSVVTADPTSKPYFMMRAGYEFKADEVFGEAVASGPLTDTLGIRVAVRGSKMFGGYYENLATAQSYTTRDVVTGIVTVHPTRPYPEGDTPKERQLYGRVTLKWEPTDRLKATLKGSAGLSNTNSGAWNMHAYACATGFSSLNPSVPCTRDFVIYQNAMPDALAALQPFGHKDGSLFNKYRSWQTTGTIEYDLGDATVTSVTNYQWNRNRWMTDSNAQSSSGNGIFSTENNRWHAFSSELRAITSYDGPLNVMVGGYYQKTNRKLEQYTPSGTLENSAAPDPRFRYLGNIKNSSTKGETASVFGQAIFTPSEQWEATAGARYIHETKDSFFVQPYSHPTGVAAGNWVPNSPIIANQTFDNWSPEVTVKWKPERDLLFYAAFKTAYKSGGFNNTTTQGRNTTLDKLLFGPEKAKGFEGGMKSTLFDRQLRFNVSAYRYTYSGLQVESFNPATFALTATNAGSARVYGAELELNWAPRALPGFTMNGLVNYNKARYTNFIAPCWTGQKPSEGCTLSTAIFGPSQDLGGTPTALAPLWTASLGVNYETPILSGLVLGASVDARYSDEYLPSQFGNRLSRQPQYVNLDASLRLRTEDDRWELAVIGKNLTNRFVVTGVMEGIQTGRGTQAESGVSADQIGFGGLPRTVRVQLTWKY